MLVELTEQQVEDLQHALTRAEVDLQRYLEGGGGFADGLTNEQITELEDAYGRWLDLYGYLADAKEADNG